MLHTPHSCFYNQVHFHIIHVPPGHHFPVPVPWQILPAAAPIPYSAIRPALKIRVILPYCPDRQKILPAVSVLQTVTGNNPCLLHSACK